MSNEMWRILVALVIAGHGVGHVYFLVPALGIAEWRQTGRSWLLSNIAGGALVRPVGSLLWLLVIAGFVAAGIGVFGMQGWWRNVAVASAVISLLAIGLFVGGLPFNPTINPVVFNLIILAALLLVHWPSVNMVGS